MNPFTSLLPFILSALFCKDKRFSFLIWFFLNMIKWRTFLHSFDKLIIIWTIKEIIISFFYKILFNFKNTLEFLFFQSSGWNSLSEFLMKISDHVCNFTLYQLFWPKIVRLYFSYLLKAFSLLIKNVWIKFWDVWEQNLFCSFYFFTIYAAHKLYFVELVWLSLTVLW